MYAVLDEKYALRSWWRIPYGCLEKKQPFAFGFDGESYNVLLQCDGKTQIKRTEIADHLIEKGIIHECECGEKTISQWQRHRKFDNRYIPQICFQITGKCNYNCKHCFARKENTVSQPEMSLEKANQLLDEACDCGIHSVLITGGEPMMHPDFLEIIDGIYKRGMSVDKINTNGYYITQELLNSLKSIGFDAPFFISFDTFQYHSWMRGEKDIAGKTLDAIRLCLENGFNVHVQMNVNRKNMSDVYHSLCLLDELGVPSTRIIKTLESPKWKINNDGMSLSIGEFYDFCLELVKKYSEKEHKMNLFIWELLSYFPGSRFLGLQPVQSCTSADKENQPVCRAIRGSLAIGASGDVFPCLEMQGFMENNGIFFGNVFQSGVRRLLQESPILDVMCLTNRDRFQSGSECASCEYAAICSGGCPALAILTNSNRYSDYLKPDRTKCIFFKEGYYEKFKNLL